MGSTGPTRIASCVWVESVQTLLEFATASKLARLPAQARWDAVALPAEPTARYRILERLDCGVGGTADRHPQRESTRRLAQSTTVVRQTNLRRIEFRSCQSPRPDSAARSSARAANTERPDAPVAPARPRLLIERPNAHRVYQRRDVLSADLEALAPDEIRSVGFLANEARGAARRIIA